MGFSCSQCGGALTPPPDARFAVCPYCGSAVYFDRSRAVLHFVAAATLDERAARGKLLAWMAGNETAKGLESEARLGGARARRFPVWRFVLAEEGGEAQWLEPARADAPAGLTEIPIPGGELRFVSAEDLSKGGLEEPEVRLDSALAWLAGRGVAADRVRETSLVHVPIHEFAYEYRGQQYRACVDAVTGRVLAARHPTKAEAPYFGLAAAATLLYLALGFATGSFLVRLLLYAAVSVPFSILAFAVAKRY